MPNPLAHRGRPPSDEIAAATLAPEAPAWITPELIRLTLRVWQPFYAQPLSEADAVMIIGNASRLFSALRS